MSSFIGHALAGAAAWLACNRLDDKRALRALPVFVLLAVCPDFDYFALWLFDYRIWPRFSHSLLFGLVTATLAWWLCGPWRKAGVARSPLLALAAASLSHPLLDVLVGAHPVALLWPLPNPDVALPIGILPSAGRLQLGNYYLWRNLLIELSILLPVMMLAVALAKRLPARKIALWAAIAVPVWLPFVAWSVQLRR